MHVKLLIVSTFLFFMIVSPVIAHPGRTASDGCHYCRTNCNKWGEAWDERHCHGAGAAPVSSSPQPVRKQLLLRPTVYPTRKPTMRPTKSPTSTRKAKSPNSNNTKTQKKNGILSSFRVKLFE